mmetsp:Transcript_33420/g.73100  ORF Transcript_33420/g.73100 Transcript_33420/m.73100 type:complete len:218 (-) Transcript_33420:782-1435(-)
MSMPEKVCSTVLYSSLSSPYMALKPVLISSLESTPSPFLSSWRKTLWISPRCRWSSCRATAMMHILLKEEAPRNFCKLARMPLLVCLFSTSAVFASDNQGCVTTWSIGRRLSGSAFSKPFTNSMPFLDNEVQGSPLRGYRSAFAFLRCSRCGPQKGALPESITYVTTPKLQRSQAAVYAFTFCDVMTSGAAYVKLPTAAFIGQPRKDMASPQSMTLM